MKNNSEKWNEKTTEKWTKKKRLIKIQMTNSIR